jgi:hypothetical protein
MAGYLFCLLYRSLYTTTMPTQQCLYDTLWTKSQDNPWCYFGIFIYQYNPGNTGITFDVFSQIRTKMLFYGGIQTQAVIDFKAILSNNTTVILTQHIFMYLIYNNIFDGKCLCNILKVALHYMVSSYINYKEKPYKPRFLSPNDHIIMYPLVAKNSPSPTPRFYLCSLY